MSGFEKRAQERKKEILQAAFDLMNTDIGTAGATMDKIAENAQVSKATISKYFGSKEGLIYEVSFAFVNDLRQEAKALIAENLPFEETLVTMSENKIRYLNRVNKQFYIDLMTYYTKKERKEFSDAMGAYTQESFSIMFGLFHRGQKEGKVDLKYSDEFSILHFQAMVGGISKPEIYAKLLPYTVGWTEVLIKGVAPKKK